MLNINKPRKFNYNPRFYNPELEEGEQKRIQFKRIRKTDRPAGMSTLRLVILLLVVLALGIFLQRQMPSSFSPKDSTIIIEELEIVN